MTAIAEPRCAPHAPTVASASADDLPVTAAWFPRWLRSVARWAAEVALLVAVYAVYAHIRDSEGAEQSRHAVGIARGHGLSVMHVEQWLGMAWEHGIQRFFLHASWLVKVFDVFYATAHVLVTAGVLIVLALFARRRYGVARNALLIGTAVALVVFALYPTMPPRLLDQSHAVDTLGTVGGLWSFRTPAIEKIADPFAAMPSLHIVWAMWCAVAVWSLCRKPWQRRLAVAYPSLTALVVVATGNHWILDLVAGAVLAGASWWLAFRLQAARDRHRQPPKASGAAADGLDLHREEADRLLVATA